MSCAVGIDFSSHFVDLVKLDESADTATWTRVKLDGGSAWDRTRHLRPRMPGASWWDDVYLAAVEKPQSAGFRPATVLHRVQGVILASIPQGIEAWEVTPAEWKAPLGLKPSVKPTIDDFPCWMQASLQEWTQDALDALGVAMFARNENAKGIAA